MNVSAQQERIYGPENAVAVVQIPSYQKLSLGLKNFLDEALEAELSPMVDVWLPGLFELNSLEGVNLEKPLVLYIVQKDDGLEQVLLIPVTDAEKFRGQFAGVSEEAENLYLGEKGYLLQRGNYAVLAGKKNKELLLNWLGDEETFSPENLPEMNLDAEVNAHIVAEKLVQYYKTSMDDVMAHMQKQHEEDENAEHVEQMQKNIQVTISMLEQLETLDLGLSFESDRAQLTKQIHPKEGTEIAKFLQDFKPLDSSRVLPFIKEKNIASVLVNADINEWIQANPEFAQSGQMMMGPEEYKEYMEEYKDLVSGSLLIEFELQPESDIPVAFQSIQPVKDVEKARELIQKSMKMMEDFEGAPDQKIKMRVKTFEGESESGIPYHSYTMQFDIEDEADKPASPFMTDGMTVYMAAVNGFMINTSGDIEKTLEDVASTPEAAESVWPNEEQKKAVAAMQINLLRVLKGAQSYMSKNSQGFNPLMLLKIPEMDTPGITWDWNTKGSDLLGELKIPSAEIRALESALSGKPVSGQKKGF